MKRKRKESPGGGSKRSIRAWVENRDSLLSHLGRRRDSTLESDTLENSFRFRWMAGARTIVEVGYKTHLRILPYAVVAGTPDGAVRFRMEGEPDRDLKGNFMVFIPPNVPHEFISTKRSLSLWAHVTCTVLGTYDVFSLFTIPVVFRGKKATAIGKLCEDLARPVTKSAAHPLLAACEHQESGLKLMKILLNEGRPIPSRDPTPEFERIQPVLASLESDLAGPISRESLAAQVNLSPTRFHTVFKKVTGEAPMRYVIRRRMDRARELLLGSAAPISEVARAVGYPDQFHFSREFKHTFQMSPVQYRRQKDRPEHWDRGDFLQRWL